MRLTDDRKEYEAGSLDDSALHTDPWALFAHWLEEYRATGASDATAFALSTVSQQGFPDARIVLLKGAEEGSLVFYTNYTSKKGQDLEAHPQAHALFFWPALERQMRIFGKVERVDAAVSDAYFHSRPIGSQRGAIASAQSQSISGRPALEAKFSAAEAIPENELQRPEHWGGYALHAERIEFWQGRPSRMHDRIVFTKSPSGWTAERLQP
jgi:pyridoxamine 5'-phosphate oxidase